MGEEEAVNAEVEAVPDIITLLAENEEVAVPPWGIWEIGKARATVVPAILIPIVIPIIKRLIVIFCYPLK